MPIDFHHHTLLYLGLYEIELSGFFQSAIKTGSHSFDVGGSGGYDALLMAKLSGGPVISFECDPSSASAMRETFARNHFTIEVVEAFVSDTDVDRCKTLDLVASETFIPDLIKIDVEGAEDAVLRGARRILAERKPHLVIEVHSVDKDVACLQILRSHGYEPRIVNQRRWLKEHRPLAHNRWPVCRGRDRPQ
jgi:hypothetical protein